MIKTATGPKDQAILFWARRKLASLLITSGSYSKYREARQLIDENLAASPDPDVDRRASALVDASFPSHENLQRSMQQLESLAQRPGFLSPEDELLLAKLSLSAGERSKALQIFRRLASQGKSATYLLALIEVLLDQKELADAESWIRRLEERAPNQYGTVEIRARLLAKQDRYDEAAERLNSFLKKDAGDPKGREIRRRLASVRLEEFGTELARQGRTEQSQRFLSDAEVDLADLSGAKNRPSLIHVLFLIRRGRNEEAIAEAGQIVQGQSPDASSKACLALAQLKTNNHAVLTRAAELVDKLTKSRPSSDAWIALGALQDRLERYDEAEQCYRQALARQPGRADALNNLAYLLVLRKKDLPEARTLIDRAIQEAGPRGALRDSRAMVELATGDTNAALADSDYACSDDLSPVHLLHQAQIRFSKGERNAAATALKKARQLGLTRASLHPLEHPVLTELETQLEVAGQ